MGNLFLNPLMLAGLGAAALPLVLHLLSRARYRSVDWGAMMFLAGADSRQRQSTQIKQWILLLIRMAIVGLLAIALARPIVRGGWTLAGQEGGVTAVVAVDCSASMALTELSRSRFDDARVAAMRILDDLRAGDQAMLLLIGGDSIEEDLQPTGDIESLKHRLATAQPTARQADIAQAIGRAADALDRAAGTNREIYLICDRQALSWRGIDSAFEQSWRARARTAGPLRWVVVDIGGEERENVAVESVAVVNPPAIAQQAGEIEIRVRNFGSVARPAWPVRVMRDHVELLATTIHLAPDSSASLRLPLTFDAAGQQVISAVAAPAGPPFDDSLSAVVSVSDPIRVLLVSGDERDGAFRSESDYLRAALMPFGVSGRTGADPARVDVVPADKWADADIHAYEVVVLANVSQITEVQARDLKQFVHDGGGLLVSVGSLFRAQNYNDALGELLPARLESFDDEHPPPRNTQLATVDAQHPVFHFLRDGGAAPPVHVAQYVAATPHEDRGRVVATYRDGAPFLLESAAGRGRVLLMTTSLDADWNALPLSNFFVPFAQSAIRYLAADQWTRHNLLPGQPIEWSYDSPPEPSATTVTCPDGAERPAEVHRFADRDTARFDDTTKPGVYVMRYTDAQAQRSAPFVVRPPFDESDLTPLSAQQWSRLAGALRFERVHSDAASLSAATSAARSVRELWPLLLATIALLAAGELLLARIWSEEDRT